MDIKKLVEEITKEVVARYSTANKPHSTETNSSFKDLDTLVLLTGGLGGEAVYNKLLPLFKIENFLWMVTPSAKEQIEKLPQVKINPVSSLPAVTPRKVIVPFLSWEDSFNLANLLPVTMVSKNILQWLQEGVEVILAEEGLEGSLTCFGKTLPLAWREKLNQRIRELETIGIKIVKIDTLLLKTDKVVETTSLYCEWERDGECKGCGFCISLTPQKVKQFIDAGATRVAAPLGAGKSSRELAKYIDHTLLKPGATREEIIKLCEEAREYGFASVCINPAFVSLAYSILKDTPVKVCTVIGFPLGATTSMVKAIETKEAIANGAEEIDMVINVGALKAKDYELVKKDIEAVVEAANGKTVKVILETSLLTEEEKRIACRLAKEAGANFVKTSTGFGPGGATLEDIKLMKEEVGDVMGIKASGGIRDFETASKMISAGATRIGASAGVTIIKGSEANKEGY